MFVSSTRFTLRRHRTWTGECSSRMRHRYCGTRLGTERVRFRLAYGRLNYAGAIAAGTTCRMVAVMEPPIALRHSGQERSSATATERCRRRPVVHPPTEHPAASHPHECAWQIHCAGYSRSFQASRSPVLTFSPVAARTSLAICCNVLHHVLYTHAGHTEGPA